MEINDMSEVLIRIDERTKNIQDDVQEIAGCVHDHEERIRALEIQRARDHGETGGRGGNTFRDVSGGAAITGGSLFALGKLLGWFRNV